MPGVVLLRPPRTPVLEGVSLISVSLEDVAVSDLECEPFLKRLRREEIENWDDLKHIRRLCLVAQVEGDSFVREKYVEYRKKEVVGLSFIVVGGASFVTSLAMLMFAVPWFSEDPSREGDFTSSAYGYSGFGFLANGLILLAVGIPMFVSGRRGKNRQNLLHGKSQIILRATEGDETTTEADYSPLEL